MGLCFFESVSLLGIGVFIVVDFARKHVEWSRPKAAFAIEREIGRRAHARRLDAANEKAPSGGRRNNSMAEEVGFEPTVPCGTTVFKTAAFNHSAIPPKP